MKKLLFSLLVTILCVVQAKAASGPENLFVETFNNVSGEIEDSTPVDPSKFDNPDGWTFDNVFAGPECIIIKKGGSVTLPAVAGLTGNAAFYFDVMPMDEEYFFSKFYTITIDKGYLSADFIEPGISVTQDYTMSDVTDESRFTITAGKDCDIMLSNVRIYYGTRGGTVGSTRDDYLVKYSVEEGEYYRPFDVTIKAANIPGKIVVYTLDGSTPLRTSLRYTEDTPLTISETTTLTAAVIFSNGYLEAGKSVTYTFPTATEPEVPASTVVINVKTGSLEDQLMEVDRDFIEGLELHGTINGKDLAAICNTKGIMSRLSYLNMKDVTFEYDDYCYKTATYAPEGGMGQSGVIYTYFSAENSEDYGSTGPMTGRYDIHSNNLANAFTAHPTLARVELPDFLTSIGSAFANCQNLTMVSMSPNMTEIGASAFNNCPIGIINIPESLEIINDYAFAGTKIIGDLNLPKLKHVGAYAFGGSKIFSFVFNSGIKHIGEGAFSGTLLTKVDLPTPPDTIYTNTFACKELKEVKFGEGLQRLESEIFGNYSPEIIELPQSLIELAADALPAKYIQSIEPEDGIRYVGGVAYQVAEDREEYTIKAGTQSIAEELFAWRPVKKVMVPNSVTIVGERAFAGSSIESLPVMEGVTEWPDQLFYSCQNLARITIPEHITRIGYSVFEYCSSLWQIKYNAVEANVMALFNQHPGRPCSFKNITIGEGVKKIPTGIFDSNHGPTDIVLPKSVERIDTAAFYFCNNLRSIYLPDGIEVIEPQTFQSCYNLEEVHMPLNLERISENAFFQCEALKTISIPEGTKILESGAFYGCRNASTLYLPSTLQYIGSAPFYYVGLDNPVKMTSASADPLIADGTLWDSTNANIVQLKVPNASVEDYKNHPEWKRFADVIVPIDEIAVSEGGSSTSFENEITEETDLTDTVIGDVYVTVGAEDSYDSTDGSIVLNSTMDTDDAEAIGGLAPGKSDLANRFNGLVVGIPAGQGTVTVDCMTIGSRAIKVKVGEDESQSFTKSNKGEISVNYNVIEDTYVYIYGSNVETGRSVNRVTSRAASDNCVKIYSVGVTPDTNGIYDITVDSETEITDFYTVDGIKVNKPTAPGVYIIRRANGSATKILIR